MTHTATDQGLNGRRNQPHEESSKDILNDIRSLLHDVLEVVGRPTPTENQEDIPAMTVAAEETKRLEGKYDPNHPEPLELFPTLGHAHLALRKLKDDMTEQHEATWPALGMLLNRHLSASVSHRGLGNIANGAAVQWQTKHKRWMPCINEERAEELVGAIVAVREEWMS